MRFLAKKHLLFRRGQSITEYILLIGIVTAALLGMQVYMKRGIQAVIKSASDEMGEQKKGAVDVDYKLDWKWKGYSKTDTSTTANKTTKKEEKGAVSYNTDEETKNKKGSIFSWGLSREKE